LTWNSTKYIKDGAGLPAPGRRGPAKPSNKSKFLSQNRLGSDTTKSMPSSPALSGVGSPSLGPTSVPLSQQQAEQAKAVRKPIIHLLAVKPMTQDELRWRTPDDAQKHLMAALQKVGDLDEATSEWQLRKNFYKELDVWSYDYTPVEDRQRAIDNAVKQFDKMRLGVNEPEWDKLLPKSERGTGKCLSKVQAQIAAGPVARAPKINVQKAEDSGRDTPNGEDDVFTDKKVSKIKGEGMARSVSQPPATKAKKVSEKDSQAKRLLSKNPVKAAAKPAPAKKVPQPKAGSKVLSSEFVNDSDEEDDYPIQTKPAPKPTMKRSRDDDLDTSDSSVPLSKKVKKDPQPAHRVSDASQSSRTTTSSHYSSSSSKVKGNSPQKSSPLASSPPTNASDMESTSGERTASSESPVHHHSTKSSRSPIHKRHQKSSSVSSSGSSRTLKPEVTDLARRFKMYYPKYKALHQELQSMGENRDKQKEKDLLEMHARLAQMKKDIEAGIIDVEPQRSD
jgi:RNA polymerase II elongation factor ELL